MVHPPATFTRDLFEAEILVPGWTRPLHVFTTHLKAGATNPDDALKRGRKRVASPIFL